MTFGTRNYPFLISSPRYDSRKDVSSPILITLPKPHHTLPREFLPLHNPLPRLIHKLQRPLIIWFRKLVRLREGVETFPVYPDDEKGGGEERVGEFRGSDVGVARAGHEEVGGGRESSGGWFSKAPVLSLVRSGQAGQVSSRFSSHGMHANDNILHVLIISYLPHPFHQPLFSTSPTLKFFSNNPSNPLESCDANSL
jgi:hypothetical protein